MCIEHGKILLNNTIFLGGLLLNLLDVRNLTRVRGHGFGVLPSAAPFSPMPCSPSLHAFRTGGEVQASKHLRVSGSGDFCATWIGAPLRNFCNSEMKPFVCRGRKDWF